MLVVRQNHIRVDWVVWTAMDATDPLSMVVGSPTDRSIK
jgi:hypothetical protein